MGTIADAISAFIASLESELIGEFQAAFSAYHIAPLIDQRRKALAMTVPIMPLFPQLCPGVEYPPKTLAELRSIEPDAVPWHHLEWMIAVYALIESDYLRMHAGPDGVLKSAARNWIIFACRGIANARLAKRSLFLWDAAMIEHLVIELTAEMQSSTKLKSEVSMGLKHTRDLIWNDGTLTKCDPNIALNNKNEDAVRTFVKALDYIEHIGRSPKRDAFINLKRQCLSCLRVANAVFATDY